MLTNAGLVAGLIVGLGFLLAGSLLVRSGWKGGAFVALGGLALSAAQLYGLVVLRPFIGRPYDEHWSTQIALVEGFSSLGLLLCAAGLLLHARALRKP